ncbi:8669_t:CDS:10 [Entrophospora sp. SA101]|nr:8669_t:CDS:10 [Entrophospora sp. SA101]
MLEEEVMMSQAQINARLQVPGEIVYSRSSSLQKHEQASELEQTITQLIESKYQKIQYTMSFPNLAIPPNYSNDMIMPRRTAVSFRERPKVSSPLHSRTDHRYRSHSYPEPSPFIIYMEPNPPPSSPLSTASKHPVPIVYPALISRVAEAFRARVILSNRMKDDIEYNFCFDGREADKIAFIIKTTDRNLALLLGRALDSQKFFHDVTYDHRLRDSPNEFRGSLSDKKDQKLWIHSVPPEIANSVSDQEKKRQEAINEVIYTEKDFVRDIEYLKNCWITPLLAQNIIPEFRREKFIRDVFHNIMEIYNVNSQLADALQKRQNSYAIVGRIGDIFLEYVTLFEPFIRYGAHQIWGRYEFEREKCINQAFSKFVEDAERRPESRKLELNGYLTKPTTRLGRYPLLLEAVLKQTPRDNDDRVNLQKVITIIKKFLSRVNVESGKSENRFHLQQLNDQLALKGTEHEELNLTAEGRQIIFRGFLSLLVKEGATEGSRKIPQSLLQVKNPNNSQKGTDLSINFTYLGRRGYSITLYASTPFVRKNWIQNIYKQKDHLNEETKVFEKTVLLGKKVFIGSNNINCACFFDHYRKLALGTDNGVYVHVIGQDAKNVVQILKMERVSQIDILEDYRLLLVLADKNFYTYPMEVLDPNDATQASKRSRKIITHANFFKSGTCLNKQLVSVVRSNALNSTIRLFEPEQIKVNKNKGMFKDFLKVNDPLKLYKEFCIPTPSTSIHFLSKRLCVGCAKGFEMVDINSSDTQALLNPNDTTLDFVQKKENIKPIAIYRISGGKFLLCYDEFAFFVNKDGYRTREDFLICWEGIPTSFVRHADSGLLEQIIEGHNLRCLCDSRGRILVVTNDPESDSSEVFSLKLVENGRVSQTASITNLNGYEYANRTNFEKDRFMALHNGYD